MTRKLTSRALQQRYGVVDRTIDRWVEAGILPEPMRVNKIRYWDEAEIEQFERKLVASRKPHERNFNGAAGCDRAR